MTGLINFCSHDLLGNDLGITGKSYNKMYYFIC